MKRTACALFFLLIALVSMASAVIITTPKGPTVIEVVARGPQGPSGPAQYHPQGVWSAYVNYSANAQVNYNGTSYVARTASTGVVPEEGTFWTLLAAKGDIGAQGAKGDQGDKGDQGLIGPAGPQGPVGQVGPQGPAGAKGDTGVQGPQGEQGAQGIPGPIGLTGPAGPMGPKGDTGATGLVGPQGPKGDKGDTGAQGPQGEQGDQGVPGPIGLTGPAGTMGPKGDTGATGLVGPQGPKGDKGDTGAQGATGEAGPQGPQGVKGDKGDPGNIGPEGPSGPAGPQGPAATITVGSVTTGAEGSNAQVSNGGSPSAAMLNFTIPVGATGQQGPAGPAGPPGPNAVSTSTSTAINGLLKGTGSSVAPAIAGTDYLLPNGSGAQLTSVLGTLDLVSDFGAVADSNGTHGSGTNNYSAIMSAIAASTTSGKPLHIPAGTFRTSVISYNIPNNATLKIYGEGTLFVDDDSPTNGVAFNGTGKTSGSALQMDGVKFTRYNTGTKETPAVFVSFYQVGKVLLNNLDVSQASSISLMPNSCGSFVMTNSKVHDTMLSGGNPTCNLDGISTYATDNVQIIGNRIWNTGDDGIAISTGGANSVVSNNIVTNIGYNYCGSGIKVASSIAGALIDGNFIGSASGGGISLVNETSSPTTQSNITIAGNMVYANTGFQGTYSTGAAINVTNKTTYAVTGVDIRGNTLIGGGIGVGAYNTTDFSQPISGVNIVGNTIRNTSYDGVYSKYVTDLMVTDNIISGAGNNGIWVGSIKGVLDVSRNNINDYSIATSGQNGIRVDSIDAAATFWYRGNNVRKVASTAGATTAITPTPAVADSGVVLQTNGTNNGSQGTLNLVAGSNMSVTDNGNGSVTLASSGGGTGGGNVTSSGTPVIGQIPAYTDTTGNFITPTYTVGNAANNLVQLDSNAKLPVLNGSQLTNLPNQLSQSTLSVYGTSTSAQAPIGFYPPNSDFALGQAYYGVTSSNNLSAASPNAGSSYRGFNLNPQYTGAGILPELDGFYSTPRNTGTGTVSVINGYNSWVRNTSTGTIGNMVGYNVMSPTNAGTVTGHISGFEVSNQGLAGVPNSYGILVNDQSGATASYAIKTGLGKVFFGDGVGVGTTAPSAGSLSVSGQLQSTAATGIPPLVVASTTNVPGLNASSLSGATFAAPGPIGITTPSTAAFTTVSASSTATAQGIVSSGTSSVSAGVASSGIELMGAGIRHGVLYWQPNESTFVFGTGNTPTDQTSPYGAGNVKVSGNLTITGNITASNLGTTASGTYTPTLTNVSGVTASTAYTNGVHYQRVGTEVTVHGRVNTTTSTNGANEVDLSLPIASNVSGSYDCSGMVIGGSGNSSVQILGSVSCDSTNHRAKVLFYNSVGVGSVDVNFEFMYTVD